MSVDLINSVANGDYVSANRLFEQRLENILEKKLYERKRMVAAEAAYSPFIRQGLAAGKRLLTPSEREKGEIDPSIKPGGVEHPTGVKPVEKKRKAPPGSSKKATQKVAAGYKKLAEPGKVIPRTMSIGDRYDKALERAKDLESRGSTGKVSAVKKAYRPYRYAMGAGKAVKGAAGLWSSALRSGMSGPLEE